MGIGISRQKLTSIIIEINESTVLGDPRLANKTAQGAMARNFASPTSPASRGQGTRASPSFTTASRATPSQAWLQGIDISERKTARKTWRESKPSHVFPPVPPLLDRPERRLV